MRILSTSNQSKGEESQVVCDHRCRRFFHMFEGDDAVYGLSFADEGEADTFGTRISGIAGSSGRAPPARPPGLAGGTSYALREHNPSSHRCFWARRSPSSSWPTCTTRRAPARSPIDIYATCTISLTSASGTGSCVSESVFLLTV